MNKTSTYIDIPNEVITKLFSSINTNLYPPIYIDNNDILFIKKNEYQAPKQISLKDSEDAIKALLFSKKLADLTDKRANETLNYLNTSVNPKTKSFSVYKYDKKYSEEISNIINNQKIGQKMSYLIN